MTENTDPISINGEAFDPDARLVDIPPASPELDASHSLMMTAQGSITAWLETGNQLPMDPCSAIKEAQELMQPAWDAWAKLQEEVEVLKSKLAGAEHAVQDSQSANLQLGEKLREAQTKAKPEHDQFGNRILTSPAEIVSHHAQQHISLFRVDCACGKKLEIRGKQTTNCPGCGRIIEL